MKGDGLVLKEAMNRIRELERELLLKNASVSTLRLEADRWKARAAADFCQMCANIPAPYTVCSECFWKAKP